MQEYFTVRFFKPSSYSLKDIGMYVCVCVCVCVCIYMYVCIYVYIYIYHA